MILLSACTTKPFKKPIRQAPSNLMVPPGELMQVNTKETEAAVIVGNIEIFGITRRNYIKLQTWAKDCR